MLGRTRFAAAVCVASLFAASLVLGLALPAAAAAANDVVTMFSDPNDYIGIGSPSEFDSSNAAFSGYATPAELNLDVSGGTTGTYWTLDVAPPPGTVFHIGYYADAQRTPFRTAGHPGLDIYGEGRGCNQVAGAFEVRRLAYANGVISRLDLIYEQHCEGVTAALFGEIRINDPSAAGVLVSSAQITWPLMPFGAQGTTVPVFVRDLTTTPASIGTLSLTGADYRMFALAGDQCSGHLLAPGGSCLFFVSFKPTARGPRNAHVTVPIGSTAKIVWLGDLVRPGSTYLNMQSDSGDYIGQGQTYAFSPANAQIDIGEAPNFFRMTVNSSSSGGGSWNVYMETAGGAVLAPGSYPNATRYPASSGNSLDVFGNGRGCNTLTGSFYVYEAVFSPVDAGLQNFKASFTQHCEGAAPALRGTVAWNAEPVTQQPPGVSNLTATASGSRELISWTNPSYSYYAYTVIRYVPGVPFAPAAISGWPVYEGRAATSATIGGLGAGARYTVSAFTVDTYGNVSGAQNLTFTAG